MQNNSNINPLSEKQNSIKKYIYIENMHILYIYAADIEKSRENSY